MSSFSVPQNDFKTGHGTSMSSPLRGPTQEDWERHRPLIKQLYAEENRKLKEVVGIMKQYGHIATPRMYRDRIKKWGLDKKNKECDMLAILRKKTERDAVGKDSSFRVRGQSVTMDTVLHYFKRKKKTREVETFAATTPSDVSCRTPSPSLDYTDQPIDDRHFSRACPSSILDSTNNDVYIDASSSERTITRPFIVDKHITRSAQRGIFNMLSESGGIPRSPSPPPTLLIPELLLARIKTYFEGSFENGTWTTNKSGYYTNITPAVTNTFSRPVNFMDYMKIAAQLIQMGSLVGFRRVLSKAFNLVQGLLRQEHPMTLCCFLDVVVDMLQQGRPEIASLLLSYIKRMATNIIAQGNPWGDICRLIGMLDGEPLEQAIIQCWKCTCDTFKHTLGQFHPSTLDILLLLNHRVLTVVEQERILRDLVARSEHNSGADNTSHLMILNYLGANVQRQGKYLEAEKLGRQVLRRAGDIEFRIENLSQTIKALELIAWMQYYQHKTREAEKTMRDAIEMIVDQWGVTDPWAISNSVYLEQWLRSWGHEDEADTMKAYREGLIGKDEIDAQSASG